MTSGDHIFRRTALWSRRGICRPQRHVTVTRVHQYRHYGVTAMASQSVQHRPDTATEQTQTDSARHRRVFIPRVDILEGDTEFLVIADIPGADENNIGISLERSVLTLSARVPSHDPQDHSILHREYEVGDFERSFTLSEVVAQDKIQANVKDGVLRLILPKAAPTQAKRIAVRAA